MLAPENDPVLLLVEEIQAGVRVEENFEELYRRFRPAVQRQFRSRGFSPQESQDLAQDVFIRAFKSIDVFRRESRFERWLWEIVSNVYLNELRRRSADKRNAKEESIDSPEETSYEEGDSLVLTMPSDDPSAEDLLIWRERREALGKAMRRLPAQMQRCVILRYEKGLKYQEIAKVEKISIETVKAHLHQARKRLIDELGG